MKVQATVAAIVFAILISGCTSTNKQTNKQEKYLPVSIMEANLLSGGVYKVGGYPVPAILNISGAAKLPNEQTQDDLLGCFVMTEGVANLAIKRVEIRPVSFECVDKNKRKAVSIQSVKGYVVDEDGIAGVKGDVIIKDGIASIKVLPGRKVTLVISEGVKY